ncbi:hypothetical protein GE061_009302 [Apolygus lucorum]|uniref:Uncharacterized protein n=1 Tax=Apolygus lucorum TaxID=248454 RepID=A0A8S9Y1A2_APOLU|nr:hypothetical protein GE061_009302 [Apolygus lucorum]
MDRLKKERSAVRRAFSRIRKTFEDEFKNEDRSFDVLQPIFVQLEHYTMKLNELDRKMMDAILDDEKTTDEVLDEEAEKVDEYQMIYLTSRYKFDSVKKDIDAVVLKAWSRQRSTRKQEFDGEQRTTDLEALMNFIKAEVDNEDRIQLAHGFTLGEVKCRKSKQPESGTNEINHWKYRWKKALQSCCQWCNVDRSYLLMVRNSVGSRVKRGRPYNAPNATRKQTVYAGQLWVAHPAHL